MSSTETYEDKRIVILLIRKMMVIVEVGTKKRWINGTWDVIVNRKLELKGRIYKNG